jgi:hypothetical protein
VTQKEKRDPAPALAATSKKVQHAGRLEPSGAMDEWGKQW